VIYLEFQLFIGQLYPGREDSNTYTSVFLLAVTHRKALFTEIPKQI